MLKRRTLLVFAVLGTVAFITERQICEALIVPRLPGVSKVPF